MIPEKRKLKNQSYYERIRAFWQNKKSEDDVEVVATLQDYRPEIETVQHVVVEKKSIEVDQQDAAKRAENDLKWKHLCDSNNNLIIKNPEARCAQISQNVRKAVERKKVKSLGEGRGSFQMHPDYYHEVLKLLLTAEEAHEHIEMRKYDQRRKRVRISPTNDVRGRQLFMYDLVGMSRGQPKLLIGDTVILDDGSNRESFEIDKVEGDTIVFKRPSKQPVIFEDVTKNLFDISFVQSGSTFDRYAKNLTETQGAQHIIGMLFEQNAIPTKVNQISKIALGATDRTKVVDERLSRCNAKQRQAIENILAAQCRPNLYVLFGPPGTGKTFTVVESVVQIYKREPEAKILICSGSNSCVDDLATFLHKTGLIDNILRLSSLAHYKSLDKVPNYFSLEYRKAGPYRVVVTTNMMASKLKSKYDFIFVDEAGHSHIPETMLPMAKLQSDGCFILAGDPKQLGPVVQNYEVLKLGLGVSLLERVFRFKLYSKKRKLGYDPRFITKLVDSYRSDPRILGLCNELFYDDELRCLGKTPPSLLRILKFDKPLVFVPTLGKEISFRGSTSRHNKKEVNTCMKFLFLLYMMGISPDQVGIITPYVLQRQMLIEELDKRLKQHSRKLNQRFKVSPPKKQAEKLNESIVSEPLSRGTHSDKALNDIDFLQKALLQLRLNAQARQGAKIVPNQTAYSGTDWHCKIDTVDSFQGNEREIIIISTVRSPNDRGAVVNPGFLTDAKRFNVAISRAKWLVIVVGHPAVLRCCRLWKKFGEHSCQ